jgi:hypothetical protein
VVKKSVVSERDVRTGRETLGSLEGEEEVGEAMGKRVRKGDSECPCGTPVHQSFTYNLSYPAANHNHIQSTGVVQDAVCGQGCVSSNQTVVGWTS